MPSCSIVHFGTSDMHDWSALVSVMLPISGYALCIVSVQRRLVTEGRAYGLNTHYYEIKLLKPHKIRRLHWHRICFIFFLQHLICPLVNHAVNREVLMQGEIRSNIHYWLTVALISAVLSLGVIGVVVSSKTEMARSPGASQTPTPERTPPESPTPTPTPCPSPDPSDPNPEPCPSPSPSPSPSPTVEPSPTPSPTM